MALVVLPLSTLLRTVFWLQERLGYWRGKEPCAGCCIFLNAYLKVKTVFLKVSNRYWRSCATLESKSTFRSSEYTLARYREH